MFEGTTKFADVQILSGKSFRSFKSFKGDLGFREKKKPFMRFLHKWQGSYNAILNMSGKVS